jgi:hypothetical protein
VGVRTKTALAAFAIALAGVAPVQAQIMPARGRSQGESYRMFHAAGELYSLDPDLLAAIATVESGGNSYAVSPKGAQGLMQLMPATADRFRVRDPFDPISNTLGAARYISFLREFRTARGAGDNLSLTEMIAAYNAGEGAVQKYGGIPPYPETQHYVRKVLLTYLFGNSRSELAARLGASPPPLPAPIPVRVKAERGRVQPVLMRGQDPIEKLTEIQHLRELEINRQQTASRNGAPDASR